MFVKKHVSESGSRLLGGKDGKTLRANLLKSGSMTEDQLETLFPKKSNVTQVKMSNRAIAYCNEQGNPLFFDPNGKADSFIPTVRHPVCCTKFCIVHQYHSPT